MGPFLKWGGSKRQLLADAKECIESILRETDGYFWYFEPFLGSGTTFFELKPKRAVISDIDGDLVSAYQVIKSEDYRALINLLREYEDNYLNDPDGFYYSIREMDRNPRWWNGFYSRNQKIQRAARLIFLNKTCYGGLYCQNDRGQFNTPIGRYRRPVICDEENITEIHNYLSDPNNNIKILRSDFEEILNKANENSVVFLDPPYDYSDDDGFTKCKLTGLSLDNFLRLKSSCDKAIYRGAHIVISLRAGDNVFQLFDCDPKYRVFRDGDVSETPWYLSGGAQENREVTIIGAPVVFPQANDMDSIVRLACLTEAELADTDRVKSIANVQADRQVGYYIGSLMYLGIIDKKRRFTPAYKDLCGDREKIETQIFAFLCENADLPFKQTYEELQEGCAISLDAVSRRIPGWANLSKATRERRASTVKRWADWMLEYHRKETPAH